jgi:TetR/AcrR family transcriptional repressor of nem operon
MPRSGEETRQRILDAAESLILGHSLAGTSIDMVLEKAGITKGAFFYHFKSKSDLAKTLMERYARQELVILNKSLERSERLSRDPLQQLLIFIGLLQEMSDRFLKSGAGCLIASYFYQAEEIDPEIREIAAETIREWHQKLTRKFEEAIAIYPPHFPVEPEYLADGLVGTVEGAFILVRVLQEPQQLEAQITNYRNYIELLFTPK